MPLTEAFIGANLPCRKAMKLGVGMETIAS